MQYCLKELKKSAVGIGIADGLLAVLFFLVGKGSGALLLGLLFGSIYSFLNMLLLANVCERTVSLPQKKAERYIKRHFCIRYLLTAVVMMLGFTAPFLHPVGVIAPILAPKLYMQITGILFSKKKQKEEC